MSKGVRRIMAALAAAAAAALGGCAAHPGSVLRPAGQAAALEFGVLRLSLWLMCGIFLAVVLPLLYILLSARRRRGDRSLPRQVEGNSTLELLWTVVPVALLVVLAVPTVRQAYRLSAAAAPGAAQALHVTVIGHQWWWEFRYPSYGIVTADELHIPAGQYVQLKIESADVIHSFWVPALAGKQDAIPGQPNTMWLNAFRPGTYPGQCAEFCGLSHSLMRFFVVAQTPAAFQDWVWGMQHPVTAPQTALAAQGQTIFQQSGCGGCHTILGTAARGQIGPNLTALGSRRVIVAGALMNNAADLAQWVHDPGVIIPGTVMPSFSYLSQQQLTALAAYLEGQRSGTPPPPGTGAG